jgi:hypothetical protein
MAGCLDIVGNLKTLKTIAIAHAAPGNMHDRVGPELAHHRRDLNPISKIGGYELEIRGDIDKPSIAASGPDRPEYFMSPTHRFAHDRSTHKAACAGDQNLHGDFFMQLFRLQSGVVALTGK